MNEKNDHQVRKLLIVRQILLVSTLKNILRTVWRICILTLECKGLRPTFSEEFYLKVQQKKIFQMIRTVYKATPVGQARVTVA